MLQRYSRSSCTSQHRRYSSSISRSLCRSRSLSRSPPNDVENPGNNLYVTGLSSRITRRELERHFSAEGMVVDVHVVIDPRTRESRGFGFVTMSSVEEADHCIKYLDRSVLEGRIINVDKTRRRRGRTPTPGRYLGLKTVGERHRSPSYSPHRSEIRSWSGSPQCSSERSRSRSYYPHYHDRRRSGRERSYSPYNGRRGSYSPHRYQGSPSAYYKRGGESLSRSCSPAADQHGAAVRGPGRRGPREGSIDAVNQD